MAKKQEIVIMGGHSFVGSTIAKELSKTHEVRIIEDIEQKLSEQLATALHKPEPIPIHNYSIMVDNAPFTYGVKGTKKNRKKNNRKKYKHK